MATNRIAKSRAITPEIGEASGHRSAVVTKKPPADARTPRTAVLTRKHPAHDPGDLGDLQDLQRKVQALSKAVEHQQILIRTMMEMIENHSTALVKLISKCSELAAKVGK